MTCPRSHSQQVSEQGFKHKPTYSQSQPSLSFVEVPSQAHRGKKGNQCQSLTLGRNIKRESAQVRFQMSQALLQSFDFSENKGLLPKADGSDSAIPLSAGAQRLTLVPVLWPSSRGFHIRFAASFSFFRPLRKARGREGDS